MQLYSLRTLTSMKSELNFSSYFMNYNADANNAEGKSEFLSFGLQIDHVNFELPIIVPAHCRSSFAIKSSDVVSKQSIVLSLSNALLLERHAEKCQFAE